MEGGIFFAGQLRIILHYRCGNDFLLMWELYFGRWENYFGKAGGKIVLAGGETILAGGKLMWRLGKLFWLVKELMWQVGKLFWQVKIVFGIQSERVNSSIMECEEFILPDWSPPDDPCHAGRRPAIFY